MLCQRSCGFARALFSGSSKKSPMSQPLEHSHRWASMAGASTREPSVEDVILALDLPSRLHAEARVAWARCRNLSFASNTLCRKLVPRGDPHLTCVSLRMPDGLFTRRTGLEPGDYAELTGAAGTEQSMHALRLATSWIVPYLSVRDRLRLSGSCRWFRRCCMVSEPDCAHIPLWTAPINPLTWYPPRWMDHPDPCDAEAAATSCASSAGSWNGACGAGGAAAGPVAVLGSLPALQRRTGLRWLARHRACPWCATASAAAGDSPAASCAAAPAAGTGKLDPSSAESVVTGSHALRVVPSLRPAVFGFASAELVDSVRRGMTVFGGDFLPAEAWQWHCSRCNRRFMGVPIPRYHALLLRASAAHATPSGGDASGAGAETALSAWIFDTAATPGTVEIASGDWTDAW